MEKIVTILVVDRFWKEKPQIFKDQLYNILRQNVSKLGFFDDEVLNTTPNGDLLRYLSNSGSFPALMIAKINLESDKITQVLHSVSGHSQIMSKVKDGSFANKYFELVNGTLFSFTTDFEYEVDREEVQEIGFQKD